MTWQDIFLHLTDAGFNVYSMGQHEGKCTAPYIVLKSDISRIEHSVEGQWYKLLLYFPADRYSQFGGYIDTVKTRMNELYPVMKLVDDQQPHYLDDDVEAYTTGLYYLTARVSKINRL
ncbi:hypothetical protein [Blautia marasmi]|uniref:hypothetical protein n=1 Tax=Blautia marasmi TaxID=1917868 RepID=UPI00351517FC